MAASLSGMAAFLSRPVASWLPAGRERHVTPVPLAVGTTRYCVFVLAPDPVTVPVRVTVLPSFVAVL